MCYKAQKNSKRCISAPFYNSKLSLRVRTLLAVFYHSSFPLASSRKLL